MNVYAIFVFFARTLASFPISDYILYIQYSKYRDSWENEGQPYGYFYTPYEVKGLRFRFTNWRATQKRAWYLLFGSPEWITSEPKVGKLIWLNRVLLLIAAFCWISIVVFGINRTK